MGKQLLYKGTVHVILPLNRYFDIRNLSIYWVSVCLFVTDKRQNGQGQHFSWDLTSYMPPGKVTGCSELQKTVSKIP